MIPFSLRIDKKISRLLLGIVLLLLTFSAQAHNQPSKNKGKANVRMSPVVTGVKSFTYTGQIETWVVPNGVYFLTIEARGGEGGTNPISPFTGGKGAIITGTIPVIPGSTLKVLVGQQAPNFNSGGGGSFVTDNSNAPLVIAGGGGGSGTGYDSDEKHGQATTSGGRGAGGGVNGGGAGGTDGNGGNSDSYNSYPSAGGGLLTNGQDGKFPNGGGKAFVNGGAGGENAGINGGFGGGGVGTDGGGIEYESGGGGGGYSGGGAAFYYDVTYIGGVGGGGGSYNAGTNPSSLTGAVSGNSGNGMVTFTYELPCEPFTATLEKNGNLTCPDNTVLLTATGGLEGATYQFSTGAQTSDPTSATATVSTSGLYSVTVTNPGGCSGTATVEVSSEQTLAAPTLSANLPPSSPGTFTAIQNTPFIALSITGCETGTVNWQGANSTSGTGTSISVPTSATGTLVYSVTCTVGSCTSSPGSATVVVSSPTETGSFDGFIYGADCSTFRGWAWDRNKPNTVFSVDIYDGDTYKNTIAANEFRQDLKDAGKGNGIHAFRWIIPEDLKDGQVHSLSARIQGSSFTLKNGPKTIQCQTGTPPPPANKPPVAPTMSPLVAQQGVDFITTLPVFTDPEGGTLSYGLADLPTGLTFTSGTRQITGKAGVEGVFVLTYSATDPQGATNSVSFNLTVAGSTPVVTGSFEGYLDKVECGTIRGWVWDRNKPNTPLTVEFYTIDAVLGSVVANIYRVDLKNAGKGNGVHAYSFEVPTILKDGNTRLIRARVSGSTYDLKDSGKPLTCPSPVRLSAETGTDFQVTVLGNPVSDQVVVEIRGAEGQPLRLQLTDASGRLLHEHQVGAAKPVERQTVSIQNQPAGLLLLRVNTSTQSHLVKILKP